MSIADKFKTLCKNIKISDDNVYSITYCYKRITKRLNIEFRGSESETLNSLYVGSYGRDTDIITSDIDMLYILPYEVYERYNAYDGNGQSALLQEVKSALQKTYPTTHIKADGQIICIKWDDGINFEIVPCFLNTDGSFTYPDTNNGGDWKTTNPKPEIETLNHANKNLCNYNLKRLCRMIRVWKYEWNVPIGGLLIDTLAYNFLIKWNHKDKSFLYYDFMVRDFFEYLSNQNPEQKYWYALGSNQFVWRKGSFEYKAKQAYNLVLEAITYENDKMNYSANEKWKKIFGSKFTG